jgi:hypothetical protein
LSEKPGKTPKGYHQDTKTPKSDFALGALIVIVLIFNPHLLIQDNHSPQAATAKPLIPLFKATYKEGKDFSENSN